MNFIETSAGIHLNFVDWGHGKPLVLLHGWPFDLQSLEYQMTDLPEQGIRCVAYDRRGFGKSTKCWEGYDYDTLADDLGSFLEKLDLRDVTLAGFSMGAGEVIRYFSRHGGKRVSKVALISPAAPFLSKTSDNPAGIDKSVFDDMVAKLEADRPSWLTSFCKQVFGAGVLSLSVSSAFLDWARDLCLQASPKATLACLRSLSETDFRAEIGAIDVPSLIIHGDADKVAPLAVAGEQAARLVPNSRFLIYPGAPHGLFYTDMDKLNQDLADFVMGRDLRAEVHAGASELAVGANLSEIGLPIT
jgi:pimeloyl-ACP methyl ester carboxylesterase